MRTEHKKVPVLKSMEIELLLPTASFLNMKNRLMYSVPDDIDPLEVFRLGFHTILSFHEEKFPQFYKEGKPRFYPQVIDYKGEDPEQVIQKETKLTGFAHWENEINKCTKIENTSPIILDGLESLRTISDMNPKLKEVFINRLNELKNGK